MKKPVKDAVNYLINTYKSVQDEARGWVLNPNDVAEALAECKPDTAEYNVLVLLAQTNFIEFVSNDTVSEALEPLVESLDADSSV